MSPKEVKSWKPNEEIVLKKKRNKNFKNEEEQMVKWKIYEFVQIKITDYFSM